MSVLTCFLALFILAKDLALAPLLAISIAFLAFNVVFKAFILGPKPVKYRTSPSKLIPKYPAFSKDGLLYKLYPSNAVPITGVIPAANSIPSRQSNPSFPSS